MGNDHEEPREDRILNGMLLRDVQEEVRVRYAAIRDSAEDAGDPLVLHVAGAAAILEKLRATERGNWGRTTADRENAVGLVLPAVLGLANELEVDSLQALRSVSLGASP